MADTANPETIKRTQEMLGKYVRKPPLTNKLLGKPPFRYLHDIINSVITDTGFLKGLYQLEELSSDNIKDKEAKISFLQKSIDATSLALGENLTVRPSKIVAGHEVEQTNEWLQAIAKAIERKVNSETAVKQVLSGTKVTKVKNNKPVDKKPDKVAKESTKKRKEDVKPGTNVVSKKITTKSPISSQDKKPQKEIRPKDKTIKKEKPDQDKIKKSPKAQEEQKRIPNGLPNGISTESKQDEVVDIVPSKQKENVRQPEKNQPLVQFPPEDFVEMVPTSLTINQTRGNSSKIADDSVIEDEKIDNGDKINRKSANSSEVAENNEDANYAGEIGLDAEGPPDSGVGSLESPNHLEDHISPNRSPNTTKTPEKPSTNNLPLSSTSKTQKSQPTKTGPIKAHHPDLSEQQQPEQNSSQKSSSNERPSTGRGIRPLTGRRSARPSSARPAPPKVRERKEIPQDEAPRPPTAKLVTNVILDAGAKDEESLEQDDDHFTVGETKVLPMEDMEILTGQKSGDFSSAHEELLDGNTDSKGLLVAQIIETKKELEDERRESFSPETPGHRRVPIDAGFGDLKIKKDQELIRKDVENLNGKIQSLTRSVLPLAKMLDYLQEDLDSMYKELDNWKDENKKLNQSLKNEQSKSDGSLDPLTAQLEDLDRAIYDRHDRISAVKSNILRNDERILKLLTAINLS